MMISGLIGELVTARADLIVAPLTINPERAQVMMLMTMQMMMMMIMIMIIIMIMIMIMIIIIIKTVGFIINSYKCKHHQDHHFNHLYGIVELEQHRTGGKSMFRIS